jgi:hypothetical protein
VTYGQDGNKISNRLRELNDTRVRLAHHTINRGDMDTTIEGLASLIPGTFDVRPKSQKHRFEPLSHEQVAQFVESVDNVMTDLRELLDTMAAALKRETSQLKSSQSTTDQRHP